MRLDAIVSNRVPNNLTELFVVRPINLSECLRKFYEGETPAQKIARMQANKERTQRMLEKWREFEEQYPDLAKRLVC